MNSKSKTKSEGKIHDSDTSEIMDMIYLAADLYCLEKHLHFTATKLSKVQPELSKKYLLIYNDIRIKRSKVIANILRAFNYNSIIEANGRKVRTDGWCMFKHTIGAFMQSSEVGIREVYKNNMEEAIEYYEMSNGILEAFWAMIGLGRKK